MENEILELVHKDRFADYVGIELVEIEKGYAKTKVKITENHLNGLDMVQGGLIFTLADCAFAAASNSKGFKTVGINANISYFHSPRGEYIYAKAKEITSSNRLTHHDIRVFDDKDELIAKVNATGYMKKN